MSSVRDQSWLSRHLDSVAACQDPVVTPLLVLCGGAAVVAGVLMMLTVDVNPVANVLLVVGAALYVAYHGAIWRRWRRR